MMMNDVEATLPVLKTGGELFRRQVRELRADKYRWAKTWVVLQGRAHSYLRLRRWAFALASFLPLVPIPSPSPQ